MRNPFHQYAIQFYLFFSFPHILTSKTFHRLSAIPYGRDWPYATPSNPPLPVDAASSSTATAAAAAAADLVSPLSLLERRPSASSGLGMPQRGASPWCWWLAGEDGSLRALGYGDLIAMDPSASHHVRAYHGITSKPGVMLEDKELTVRGGRFDLL